MNNQKTNLVFIDFNVANYQNLLRDLAPGTEAIVLDPTKDGVEQISEILASINNINSLEIVSHGSSGSLKLGSTVLDSNNIETYSEQLEQWGNSLTEDGDILLYGCNVAFSEKGKAFVDRLSALTNADIAASEDLTGNKLLNGDWELEYTTGLIDAPLALQIEAIEAYTGVLREAIEVTNTNNDGEGSLRQAIMAAALLPDLDTIDLSAIEGQIISAHSFVIEEENDIQFEGAGVTIDGDDSGRLFTVNGADVSFTDLKLINGKFQGANGSKGKGGNLGSGGALFINSDSAVTINNVTFDGNSAIGGSSSGRGGAGGDGGLTSGDSGSSGSSGSSGGSGGVFRLFGGSTGARSGESGTNSTTFGVGGPSAGGGGGGYDSNSGANGGRGGNGSFGAGGGGGGGGGGRGNSLANAQNGSGGSGGSGGSFGGDGSSGNAGSGGNLVLAGSGGSGGTGGGGAGLGGAVFVNSGAELKIFNSTFSRNETQGGSGANDGQGKGGAIFIQDTAVVSGTNLTFSGNDAETADNSFTGFDEFQDNNAVYGTIAEVPVTMPTDTVEVHRFFEYEKGFHLYTTDESEISTVQRRSEEGELSYSYEGERFTVLNSDRDFLTGSILEEPQPVYRFFNTSTGAHLYTMDEVERAFVDDNFSNYNFEGIKYYAFAEEIEELNTIPIYRMYSSLSDSHLYTIDADEKDSVLENLPHYSLEGNNGIAYHVFEL